MSINVFIPLATDTGVGATEIPVASAIGFSAGQAVTIGSGANSETSAVAVITRLGGSTEVTLASPLTVAHPAGAQVWGSGITLSAALTQPHRVGAQVSANSPAPGGPNKY